GTYWLIGTSVTGCKDSCSFTFSKDFSTVTPTCSPISLSCNNPSQQYTGSFAGATTVLKFGHTGTPLTLPYTFTSADAAGTYWVVTTKTATGCKDSCSFVLSKDFTSIPPSCSPISLSCNNPSQQYTGSFAGATTVLKFGHTGTPLTLPYTFTSADAAGTYWVVTTKTATGCKDSCSFVLSKDFTSIPPSCSPISLTCNNPSQQYVGSF